MNCSVQIPNQEALNSFCRGLTCFKFKVKFVAVGVKRSRQGNPHPEILSSANNEVLTLVEICVVLCSVLP